MVLTNKPGSIWGNDKWNKGRFKYKYYKVIEKDALNRYDFIIDS